MFVYDNTVLFEFISARFIFMHMRAKNYMGILDLFPSEFSRMRGVCKHAGRKQTRHEVV